MGTEGASLSWKKCKGLLMGQDKQGSPFLGADAFGKAEIARMRKLKLTWNGSTLGAIFMGSYLGQTMTSSESCEGKALA